MGPIEDAVELLAKLVSDHEVEPLISANRVLGRRVHRLDGPAKAAGHARYTAEIAPPRLVARILTFGPISGAHFNPAVTLADAWQGCTARRHVPGYVAAQVAGAFAGVAAARPMVGEPLFFASRHARAGGARLWSVFVATFGLIGVIGGCSRRRPAVTPFAVAAHITAAYRFTAPTSFANPAVTLARSASHSFAGIRSADAPGFVAARLVGAAAATALVRRLVPALPAVAPDVVVPHGDSSGRVAYADAVSAKGVRI